MENTINRFKLAIFLILILVGISVVLKQPVIQEKVLAKREISLADRQPDPWVNSVFKDNILLNIAYMRGLVKNSNDINWDSVRKPFIYKLVLKPSETFAFHDDVRAGINSINQTTRAHFNAQEGFKSDGYLMGDGVCHLASLVYWATKDAGIFALAPTNHNFMAINSIPKEYGVAIYSSPDNKTIGAEQNLYVKNTKSKPIELVFAYQQEQLSVSVVEIN